MKKYIALSLVFSACALQGMHPRYGQGQRGTNFVPDPGTGGRVAVAVYPPLMQEHPGQPSNPSYHVPRPPAAQQQSDIAALTAAVQQLSANMNKLEQNVNDKLYWLDKQQLALAKLVGGMSETGYLANGDHSLCASCHRNGSMSCDTCLRKKLRSSIEYTQEKE